MKTFKDRLLNAAASYIEYMELEHNLNEDVMADLVFLVDGLVICPDQFILDNEKKEN